jgi:hypothetical protein
MKMAFAWITSAFVATAALAAEPTDSASFYTSQTDRVFIGKARGPFQLPARLLEGDEAPVHTWEGVVSGQHLVLALHGDEIKVMIGQSANVLNLKTAYSLPDDEPASLDPKGVVLYVHSSRHARNSSLCVESLAPGADKASPYRSAYVMLDPTGDARLYKVPRRFASCLGLVRSRFSITPWARTA